jgi:O-antigen ligase
VAALRIPRVTRTEQAPPRLSLALGILLPLGVVIALSGLALRLSLLPLLVLAAVPALWLLHRPALLVLAYGFVALLSGWFVALGQAGVLHSPPYVTSGWAWAALLCGVALLYRPSSVLPRRVTAALLIYAAALTYSTVLAGFRSGSASTVITGAKTLLDLLSVFAIVALLRRTRSPSTGLWVVLGLLTFELAFSAVQYTRLPAQGAGWFTLAPDQIWWAPRAVYGTLMTLGKNGFGNVLALCAPVPFAYAVYGHRTRLQLFCAALVAGTLTFAVLSLAREALVAQVLAGAVVALPRFRTAHALALAAGLLAVAMLPTSGALFGKLSVSGSDDADLHDRLVTWEAVLAEIGQSSYLHLFGIGFGAGPALTQSLNIQFASHADPATVHSVDSPTTVYPLTSTTENLYLRWLAEGGLPGLAALLLLYGLLFGESFAPSQTPRQRFWRLVLRGVVVAVMAESLVMDTLMYEQIAMTFWLLVGVCIAGLGSWPGDVRRAAVQSPVRSLVAPARRLLPAPRLGAERAAQG